MDSIDFASREAEVLKAGASGLRDAVAQTWSDAGKELSKGVLQASGHYLENHWKDAVAGAAISVVNPKGMANALLVAWSMRGLAGATLEASVAAADPTADLDKAKNKFRASIANEGESFIASTPMLLAGSSVGRAGANAVFGKDMAAWDLASGKIKPADVKANLLDMKDTVSPPKIKLLVSDLDGTVWPFSEFFGPAAREAVKEMATKLGKPPEEVAESIGKVMEERRSHEYPWILEESSIAKEYKGTSEQFEHEIVKPFWATIDQYRNRYMTKFPEVDSVLEKLNERGITVVGLSDAPRYIAKRRFVEAGLDGPMKRLYALDTTIPSITDVKDPYALMHGLNRMKDFWSTPSRLSDDSYIAVPRAFEKPNSGGLDMILKDYNVRPKEVLAVIGDSRVKDGGVAATRNVRFIWARYGAHIPAEYDEVLAGFKRPAEVSGTEGVKAVKKYAPIYAEAGTYEELLKHMDPKADYAKIAVDTANSLAVLPRFKSVFGFGLLGRNETQQEK